MNHLILYFKMFKFSSFRLAVPALLGTLANILQLICLYLTTISIFQLFQSAIVVFMPLFARLILKKRLYR